MKKERGVTVVSLILYVGALLMVAIIIGRITTFFYNNVMSVQESSDYSDAYSKLNLAILSLLEDDEISNIEIGDFKKEKNEYVFMPSDTSDGTAIEVTLGKDENKVTKTIGIINNQVYVDKVLIVEDASNFSLSENHDTLEDKENYTIDLKIKVGKENFRHTYTSVVK